MCCGTPEVYRGLQLQNRSHITAGSAAGPKDTIYAKGIFKYMALLTVLLSIYKPTQKGLCHVWKCTTREAHAELIPTTPTSAAAWPNYRPRSHQDAVRLH
jgi:hypothetical protein